MAPNSISFPRDDGIFRYSIFLGLAGTLHDHGQTLRRCRTPDCDISVATGLGWSLFMPGATYGHIREVIIAGNYAPYNFLTIFSDGFVAVWLLVLLILHYRQGGFGEELPRSP